MTNPVETLDRAEIVEAFRFLDALRESGTVNMYGASGALGAALGLDRAEARTILVLWMRTFDGQLSASERVSIALGIV